MPTAYDVHVVRTKNWFDASQKPFVREDIDRLIAMDAELAWSTKDYVEMRDEGCGVQRYYAITWRGEPAFLWYRDQLTCWGPMEEQIIKLVEIAKRLDASAVGDDGETV